MPTFSIVNAFTENGSFGPQYVLDVDGILSETHRVIIPFVCLPDRRNREGYVMPDGQENCTDGTCDGCVFALNVLFTEHYMRLNPDKAPEMALSDPMAQRIIDISGVVVQPKEQVAADPSFANAINSKLPA